MSSNFFIQKFLVPKRRHHKLYNFQMVIDSITIKRCLQCSVHGSVIKLFCFLWMIAGKLLHFIREALDFYFSWERQRELVKWINSYEVKCFCAFLFVSYFHFLFISNVNCDALLIIKNYIVKYVWICCQINKKEFYTCMLCIVLKFNFLSCTMSREESRAAG